MAQRKFTGVLSSGVRIDLRNLTGGDQDLITGANTDGSAFNKMLSQCILQLGNKFPVTESDVDRLLSNDRKDALVMLRQHSLKFEERFQFVWDWPLDENRLKYKQQCEVNFNTYTFERVPYLWVRQEMERIAQLPADERPALGEDYNAFPIMYDSYEEMLAANATQRFTMPESGDVVVWNLLAAGVEKVFASKMRAGDININTMISMRAPKQLLGDEGNNKDVRMGWSHKHADALDVEGFRKEIRRVEGSIDTSLVIEHEKRPGKEARVDLVSTAAFFFPSMGT